MKDSNNASKPPPTRQEALLNRLMIGAVLVSLNLTVFLGPLSNNLGMVIAVLVVNVLMLAVAT